MMLLEGHLLMNDFEREVIEAAIEYVNQRRRGQPLVRERSEQSLFDSVDALNDENDGRWVAT